MTEAISQDLDTLLNSSIDELADLPEFTVLPAGAHKCVINWEAKTINKHPALEMKIKLVETTEMADATVQPLAPGAETSVLFMLDNEFGQGKMKAVMAELAKSTGTSSIKETMEASSGMEVTLITKVRQNKDKTQNYTEIVKVIV
jgi:hypothetical protein